MVRITKTMQAKHAESLSPWIKEFRTAACSVPLPLLPQNLASFPTRWPFPRGDLYHWIALLNRFDDILDKFCKTYKLDEGPQTTEFACIVLESAAGTSEQDLDGRSLSELGYGQDGDKQLVESILNFSRMLLQNCGNRSIYASSAHLNSLLNSTSLSLLECTLSLGSELAQRYQAALKRTNIPNRHITNTLLANHYNIDLGRVLQLALPFSKTITTHAEATQPNTPATPTIKGKEKAYFSIPTTSQKSSTTTVFANDFVSMVKGGSGVHSSPKTVRNGVDRRSSSGSEHDWEEWGDVKLTYYPKTALEVDLAANALPAASAAPSLIPVTPTPVRRSSTLGPHGQRANRQTNSEESPASLPRASTLPSTSTEEPARQNFKTIEIPSGKVKSEGLHALLREHMHDLPQELRYELLTKLRVSQALTSSLETRRQILAIRLLAITNLAYVHSETSFHENVLKQDSDEPRRLQLTYQLAELVHPPPEGEIPVPRSLQTLAFSALDALTCHQSRFQDICSALNVSVNHGVLLYVIRKAVAEMGIEDSGEQFTEADEWRRSLFSLLSNLSITPRTGGDLVTAGLIPILVEVLSLRTTVAERYHPTILSFLDTILYSARDAFQTLINADGLDTVSSLIVFEVKTAAEDAASGSGMQAKYRSSSVDYEVPFFKQQTLKWLFKFIHHMMSTAGGYGGNFDRLLRNLIDSSQLLGALRQIISNSRCFGSIVWTNAVNILNDFINNEPTSFAVIAEAGLSRGLLEAVTGSPIVMPEEPKKEEPQPETTVGSSQAGESASPPSDEDDESDDEMPVSVERPTVAMLQAPREGPLARGIMPTSETINIIPQAFGAICLNNAGMKMFQASKALECFFEIFESPEHVKCMESNRDLPSNLGGTFDELVRHHPPLKPAIMSAVLNMVARVVYLCKTKAEQEKIGAKLWTTDLTGKPVIADSQIQFSLVDRSATNKGKGIDTSGDVVMEDAEPEDTESAPVPTPSPKITSTASMTPYVTAVGLFLSAMLSNSSVRSDFSSKGGIELVLELTDSPCLSYDFGDGVASLTLQQVIAQLSESKPHLVMPSLLKRAQLAADTLKPFTDHMSGGSFFAPFVNAELQKSAPNEFLAKGTAFAKAFVNIHSVIGTLYQCLQQTTFQQQQHHRMSNTIFNQINVGDYYVQLVQSLGPLLGSSLKEDAQLQKIVPDYWKNASRVKDVGFGDTLSDAGLAVEPSSPPAEEVAAEPQPVEAVPEALSNGASPTTELATTSSSLFGKKKQPTKAEQESPAFKNYQTLHYLLSRMSRIINPFFQTLGKTLVAKRNPDAYQKQNNIAIAEAMADTILQQLAPCENENTSEHYAYLIGIMHVLRAMLIENSRHSERPVQVVTVILQAFKDRGGFDTLNRILDIFTSEILANKLSQLESDPTSEQLEARYRNLNATAGARNILTLYGEIVNGKNVAEASQTIALSQRSERDRSRPDQFIVGQFLVELRVAILPKIRQLWESEIIEKGTSQISEKLIEVIQTIAAADFEDGAFKRADKPVPQIAPSRKYFKVNAEYKTNLIEDEYDTDLATEALYRCNNNISFALEYCREAKNGNNRRHPAPEGDLAPNQDPSASSRPPTTASTGTATPEEPHVPSRETVSGIIDALIEEQVPAGSSTGESNEPALFNEILNQLAVESSSAPKPTPADEPTVPTPAEEVQRKRVTIDDLNEERQAIRDNLIDKCLDVINAHGDVTFEVSDLITTVVNKSGDASAQRKVVGETLVIALMSFAGEEDLRGCGKKVAAYAHLLALMLRDKAFYSAAVGELKENLSTLLEFVKLSPNHSAEEPSPWIAHILLIIEMLLSEDSRPRKAKWKPPKDDKEAVEAPVVEMPDPSVPPEERIQLLDAILHILPKIGKEESLALAVLRILVILTRTRSIAQTMGEKKNIQRLFVMAKQLAGASSARIQSPLMLILRHIIEDNDTVKQIMRAEIKSYLDTNRTQRTIDEKIYLRGLSHVALRNPDLFVEVTNEMVKIGRWSYPSAEGQSSRHSSVRFELKADTPEAPPTITEDAVQPTVKATEDLSIQDVKQTTEAVDSEMPDVPKAATHEHKLPVLEHPDGVIHFLLCELLNYRDVEDKEPANSANSASSTQKLSTSTNGDIAMTGTSSDGSSQPSIEATPKDGKSTKPGKVEFKSEDHPIYIYRCFILQCLTELLQSYNRTKVEFINFKRSAPPQAMTPSKPRSSVVNYLLYDLIPIGTLDHAETTALRKKLVTSSWADSVLTALLSKTGEQPLDKNRDPYDNEGEPDLLFVRRFVLENISKAYKEASASTEPIDVKYARMLSLADLMNHIMNGKENVGTSDTAIASASQKQLRRIMFEKGFVAALTGSIADIDLNFPGAKRAVKYILRPLKTLTTTAINLSDLSLISATPGETDQDEIESATSLSEPDDDREETPDLFRNSTLGMFEPGREEDTSSESDDDDEEMYEGDYDEEMEYAEEEHDQEDQISDEDEEIEGMEGMGPIEGLPGDHAMEIEVAMEDDDDDDDDDEHDEGTSGEDDGDDDDDDDDEHDSEDDDARVEIIDEAGNIQELAEQDDDDLGEWESDEEGDEGEEEDYEGQAADAEEAQLHAMDAMGGPLGNLVRALGGNDEAADIIDRMEAEGIDVGDEEGQMAGQFGEEGDEEEDDEDEDDMDEEDMLFDQYPIDGPGAVSFGWQEDVEPPVIVHRRPRGGFPPFPLFPGGPRDPLGDYRSSYRSFRSNPPQSRSADDGVNPLLQRNGSGTPGRDGSGRVLNMGSFMQALGPGGDMLDIGLGRPIGESPEATRFFEEVIRSLPHMPGTAIARNGHALQFHITAGPGHQIPPDIQAMFGMRPPRIESRRDAAEPGNAAFFIPLSTAARWLEESKIIFGAASVERATDLANAILALLVPPAIEADKVARAAEEERLRKLKEEADKKAEEERKAKEAREAEEKIAREKKEAEEREIAERAAAEALAARGPEIEQTEHTGSARTDSNSEPMEGVETEGAQETADRPQETPAADRPRITTMIRGSPFDITDLGIDPDFLSELPEEIREEVIMSTVAERRSQAAQTGSQPSEIDQEFLAALPEDIRDEIIQQERADRRRREREERNRAAAAANGGAAPDMDPASILATLPAALRNQVLMEQDDATLALLPQELAEQARAAIRELPGHPRVPAGFPRRVAPPGGDPRQADTSRPPRRTIVQMLDKAGVATLLRLMFIFQHGSLRTTLNSVLQNVSLNRHNRNEVLSTLLHILQDGSMDMAAVEKSFTHLSLRAKQPKDAQPKTPQPPKRSLTGLGGITQTVSDASPLLVVQQCLSTLVYLNQVNPHVPAFFLTEHDGLGLKRIQSRKGKGKEKEKDHRAAKYPLNSVLSLLDRDIIMESSTVMESLSTLLNMVTSPLQALTRKQKEIEDVPKNDSPPPATETTDTAAPAAEATATTVTEESSEPQPEPSTSEPTSTDAAAPSQPTVNAEGGEPTTDAPAEVADTTPKETDKKLRLFGPPVVPEHNLKLVINIFVARECSSKTFRETLSTIKNLSAIPGAKAIFGRELILKAQGMGEIILVDLEELLPQIQKATTGTEIQGVALAKFSPGSSDQNKLLRVLTALDHLFDPKREKKDKPTEAETEGESSQLVEKQDLLSSLYQNPTFGRMWERLSTCLSAIRQREHLLNVATILLPLIESLMVVCKNTTIKEQPVPRAKEMMLTSPPPESRMESLFFTFTEEHRKILNDLVRHSPKLMSGTFSLLVKNPKVLEFDNKRNYFNRSIHAKAPNGRQSFPPLQLSVRRDQVFHDSFKSLHYRSGDEMKYGKLSIRFHGEEGVDAGGVTREWFQVLSRQMFDPGYALFIPVSSDRTTFHPNQLSGINEEHLMFFKFIGRIIGKALYEGRVLDCHFSRAVYKRILGKAVSVKDMESLDPDYYKSLVWMLENDITDIITETFSVDNDKFGVVETIDFVPNGRNIPVTEENKQEYVRLMVEWRLTGSVKEQLDEFLKGFHDIIPAELVAIFNENELELLISGLPEIDVDDWKSNTEYHNYTASSPQIQWFWRAVRSFDKEERAKLLQFVTGTSKVPLNGFQELEGMNGFSRFNIHRDYGNKERLPSSHTCFNQLDLPEYESYETLRQQVHTAITAGSEYFGFA